MPIYCLDASESSVVKRCRQYMLHSRIAKGALIGEFVETTGRNCVTIASPKFAFMAAHCVPEGFPEDRTFKVYGNDNGESYKVRIHHIARSNEAGGNDFAILKLQSGEFPFYPPNASMTETGDSYFVLGYDGEFPLSDRLSCFKGTFRNTEIYLGKNYVIGTPGTTSGCSGGGVFSMHGTLYGICVSGRIDDTLQPMSLVNHLEIMKLKLSEPSYSHIIPAVFLFGHIPQTRKRKGDGSAMQQWKRVQGSS